MSRSVAIGPYRIGPDYPPFIVAELSGNHNRSLERALRLVEAAKTAGVHAVKLQTYTPDTITLNKKRGEFLVNEKSSPWYGKSLYELYQEAYLPQEWHLPIMRKCKELDLQVFSTPFDETAVDFLETLHVPCYKIASPEIVDLPLIQKVASLGKPVILSTGAATLAEIAEAVQTARNAGCSELILLKCTASYPAAAEDANLRTVPHMAEAFDVVVGLSDHTLGIGTPIAGVALGCCLIEKHFTLDRNEGGVDSSFSLNPEEMKSLVQECKAAYEALGTVRYGVLPSEQSVRSHRPSLYFLVDLEAGEIIRDYHIGTVRPGEGLPPKEIEKILGMQLKKDVKAGTPVSWDRFQ